MVESKQEMIDEAIRLAAASEPRPGDVPFGHAATGKPFMVRQYTPPAHDQCGLDIGKGVADMKWDYGKTHGYVPAHKRVAPQEPIERRGKEAIVDGTDQPGTGDPLGR